MKISALTTTLAAAAFALALTPTLTACESDDGASGDASTSGDTTGGGGDTSTGKPDTTSSGTNRPPELQRIGDKVATVNQTLVIQVEAQDPDGDELTYSVFGALPEGARFDKTAHRFEWTPTEAGKSVFLTFVVNDGEEFDRETVRIEVSASAQANPPKLADVGDQQVRVGELFTLQLSGTDPDGDVLTYGHEGTLPSGAMLDAPSGLFQWRPPSDLAGKTIRIIFTVSDGGLSDSTTVNFIVSDGSGPVQAPPVFVPIAPQTVVVGETLTLVLVANDPDGDPLTFSIKEGAPASALLTGATFTFQPTAADAGITYSIIFNVTDGTFDAVTEAQISVISQATGACSPDSFEPNGSLGEAKPITGQIQANICQDDTANDDLDYYSIEVQAGNELTVTMTFDGSSGADLDLLLLDATEDFLRVSEGLTSTEELRWTAETTQTVFIVVYAIGDSVAANYTLTPVQGAAVPCTDDAQEDNDSPAAAKPVPASGATLQICTDDADYYTMSVQCGAPIDIIMSITETGDLDMRLWDNATGDGTPLASAASIDPVEVIEVSGAPSSGTYLLEVFGYEQSESAYTLDVSLGAACSDDVFAGNSSSATAASILKSDESFAGGALCCTDDWFVMNLAENDKLLILAGPSGGSGTTGLTVYGPDGSTQITSQPPSPDGVSVEFTAASSANHYIVVSGAAGTQYALEWEVESGATGSCTSLSCDRYEVCNPDTGECVEDWCTEDADCPSGHICRETYCTNACGSDDDCRTSYVCKAFDVGLHCGIEGLGGHGESCSDHTDCAGQDVCVFKDNGGYCAAAGCNLAEVECDFSTTTCSETLDGFICALDCFDDTDCRTDDGFSCSVEDTCQPQ